MDFGKNRVQYKEFVWTYLDYDRYRVYFYQGGIETAKYASLSFNKQLSMLEKRLDFQVDDKLNVIVYNNQEDFKQSNLGLSGDDQNNIGGVTRIVGDKICVFFNGSHVELDQQIRAALAQLLLDKMLYGGNAREMVRNSTLLYIPDWYIAGLVKYLSEGWTSYNDNLMYDALKNDDFSSFNRLSGRQATAAGHALWYYIVSTYGESMIPTILYMTRVSRSLDNAFVTTIGVTLDNLIYDFNESYNRRLYMFRDSLRQSPIVTDNSVLRRYRDTKHYYQVKISPDGKEVMYATNELNQLRVYVKNIETGKTKRILNANPKLEQVDDYNYPLLAWHPGGKSAIMIYPVKSELVLQIVNFETNERIKRPMPGFEKVNSVSFNNDGKKLALSAVKKGKGQSDIFVFTMNTSGIEQLTNDIWDDNNPVFVKNSKQLVFESNRVNDTVKATDDARFFVKMNRNMDLFMAQYPFTNKVLVRVTNTPDFNETFPQAYTNHYVCYLSDRNGIYNRFLAHYDSSISFVDTTEHYRYFFNSSPVSNYERSILEQNISPDGGFVAERFYVNGNDMLSVSPLQTLNEIKMKQPQNTWFRGYISPAITNPGEYKEVRTDESAVTAPKTDPGTKGIDFDNYRFEGEKGVTEQRRDEPAKRDTIQTRPHGPKPFRFPIQKNYNTAFYTDYVVTQFDNSYFSNNYQVFSNSGSPVYLNPGFNFVNKVAISDLFEDMRIVGGYRFNPFPSGGNEFMLSWEQRRGKIDHQILLDRMTLDKESAAGDVTGKMHTYSTRYSMRIPFSPVASVRFSLLYRFDQNVTLSYGDVSVGRKNTYSSLAGTRAEFIYDNTRKVMLNILNGMRAKVWTEYWLHTGDKVGNLFTSGFDVRHYQRVHRQITWCNRFAGGNSLGSERLLFYLGGVDNWFRPTFNNNVTVLHPETYGYQTLATDMRGFTQNIRNGNNFLLYNTELRVPFVRYFIDYPLRSDFLNNLQFLGFTDLGMAWYGSNPLSGENTENVKAYIDHDPVSGTGSTGVIVTVIDNKNPLIGGVGFGLRSRVLGYFMRLDFGWGIDNWQLQNKVVALSFTSDF